MAKKVIKTKAAKINQEKDISLLTDKIFIFIIPLLIIVYYLLSKYSIGFYQDDEIAQYLNMIDFWGNPFAILGNNPKPGYKIFMVLPALISYDAVLIVNSTFSALAVYFTYRLLKLHNLKYAFAGAFLLAVQPTFFDLSFRSYSEIFTALLVVFFLILYKKEKYFLSGLICGYIYTVRQEIAIFCVFLAVIFIYKKQFISVISVAVFPVIYNLLGFLKTGDILFIISEMKSVAGLNYQSQGLLHYFKVYIFIIGPVSFSLFLMGFFGFFADLKNSKDYIKKYIIFYILFVTIFAVQLLTMINDGPNPGNWRYLLHISPVAIFFATLSLNQLKDEKFRKYSYVMLGFLIFITLIFLSKETDGFRLLDEPNYLKATIIAVMLLLFISVPSKSAVYYLNRLAVFILILAVLYLIIDYKPKELSAENQTVQKSAEFVESLNLSDVNILSNHALFKFFYKDYKKNPSVFKPLNDSILKTVPKGSIIIWDTHYGYRPEFKSDLKPENFNNENFKFLTQLNSNDPRYRFSIIIFEKLN